MENHNFLWENSLSTTMFNSYVKLPEGIIFSTLSTTPKPHKTSRPAATAGAASAHRGHVHRRLQLRQALGHLELPTGLTSRGARPLTKKPSVGEHNYIISLWFMVLITFCNYS